MIQDSYPNEFIEECLLDRERILATIQEMRSNAARLGVPIASRAEDDPVILFIASLEQSIREIDAIVASPAKAVSAGIALLG